MSWRSKAAEAGAKLKPETPLTREAFKAISRRQWERLEDRVTRAFESYFADSVRRMADRISQMKFPDLSPEMARANTARAISESFDLQQEHDEILEVGGRALLQAFVAGARTEEELMKSIDSKATSAEEIAQRLEYDIPDGIGLGPYPDWMIEAGSDALYESFQEPYWLKIPQTTRNDVSRTLLDAFETGLSEKKIVKAIMDKHGGAPYTTARARTVARTEIGHMANAGHAAGIENLQMESGIAIKKVWVSIFAATTRADHAAADGQKVASGFLFKLGGEQCRWPSDNRLSAKQRCNCYCTIITDLAENELFDDLPLIPEQPLPEEIVETAPPVGIFLDLPIVELEPEEEMDIEMGIPHLRHLTRTDIRLGGSTGAEVWEDANGNKYVVKKGSSPEHVTEEYIAEELYRSMGVDVPMSRLIDDNGRPIKISKFIEGGRTIGSLSGKERKEAIKKAQKGFGADALLANWDAAGMGLDNMLIDDKGKVWRIDTGGALRFRAQGMPKAGMFSDEVVELWTLRDQKLNRDAHEMFGGMTYSAVRTSYRKALSGAKHMEGILTQMEQVHGVEVAQLRVKLANRVASLKEIEKQTATMIQDKYEADYVDLFTKHTTNIRHSGIAKRFPEMLKSMDGDRVMMLDENGKLFDELRGREGRTKDLREYLERSGLNYEIIEKYADAQAGSSWSGKAITKKFHNVLTRKVSPNDYYWNEKARRMMTTKKYGPWDDVPTEKLTKKTMKDSLARALKGAPFSVDEYRETMAAQHAFTYELLKKTKMPNSDQRKRMLSLVRTEERYVMELNKQFEQGDYGVMTRGAGESFSLVQTVTVKGNVLTYQEVPFHRVIGTYFQARNAGWGSDKGLFLGDSENEFVVNPQGLESMRDKPTGSGRAVLPLKKWQKLKKRKVD